MKPPWARRTLAIPRKHDGKSGKLNEWPKDTLPHVWAIKTRPNSPCIVLRHILFYRSVRVVRAKLVFVAFLLSITTKRSFILLSSPWAYSYP